MKLNRCRSCNSKKLKKLLTFGNMSFTGKFPKANKIIKKKPINLVICLNCELVQLGHNFNLKYLYGPDYGYRTGINKTMRDHVRKVAEYLSKKTKLKKNDLVLDIASNDGSLLNNYNKNILTFGIDPVLKKFKKEYKNINYKVNDFFSKKNIQKYVKRKFKIITALSVFYDAAKPNKFLSDAKNILAKDGILLLEFADLFSIVKYKMFDTICHEHLEYYSSRVMINLAKKNNLRIFDIKRNNINGSSKQFYLCHHNGPFRSNEKIIRKELVAEEKLKLQNIKTFKNFFKEINKIKTNLFNFLIRMRKKGKIIHCYGASTKGNVILQYFGITNNLIKYAAERNRNKFNLYTPGSKIRIISEKHSRALQPDFYLVLPWHFKKEILIREKEIRKKGTRFIFPLPSFKVI